jgi:hypothetical protein
MNDKLEVDDDFIQAFESRRDADFFEHHADELDAMWAELVDEEEAHRHVAELQRRLAKLKALQHRRKESNHG